MAYVEPPHDRRLVTAFRTYWVATKRPLQMLVLLLPLVIAYELGLALVLRSEEGVLTNKAHETLLETFEQLGVPAVSGLYLGGIVIVVVMFVWHVLNRDPWKISGTTAGFMAAEALVLTVPLLVLSLLISRQDLSAAAGPPQVQLAELGLWSKMAISIGAGLYEELLFRMVLIALVHTLLVDLARLPDAAGTALAILLSAAAFTIYHPLRDQLGIVSVSKVIFYFMAGLYFGAIYVLRGFGIVVAVHALYDILTLSMLSANPT
jgi:membrane protease YdiL (CAAX protease family)